MKLYYFNPAEFTRGGVDWFPLMDPRLLVLLDVFRHKWAAALQISAHPDALGRHLGARVLSDHNVDKHGAVMAADLMPGGMQFREDADRAVRIAIDIGFTSIGVYPHWKPSPGLHLGTRITEQPGSPATWGGILEDGRQKYSTLAEALALMPPRPEVTT